MQLQMRSNRRFDRHTNLKQGQAKRQRLEPLTSCQRPGPGLEAQYNDPNQDKTFCHFWCESTIKVKCWCWGYLRLPLHNITFHIKTLLFCLYLGVAFFFSSHLFIKCELSSFSLAKSSPFITQSVAGTGIYCCMYFPLAAILGVNQKCSPEAQMWMCVNFSIQHILANIKKTAN